jgi:DNA polymerase III epsilon subunit-like protein
LIVIYNNSYDLRLCRQSAKAHGVEPWAPPETICAMELYAKFYGEWNDYHKSYRWQKQSDAAHQLGIEIPADLHRAAADANLCRLIIEAMAATPLPGEVTANTTLNLISEQANTIDGLLKWLCAAGLDDDHAKEDGGKPDQMIEAERVLRRAMNYLLEEYNG